MNSHKICRKLLKGINYQFDHKLTFNTKEFVGREGLMHSYYTIAEGVFDTDKNKYVNEPLFSSGSMIEIIFFLRDFLYIEQGIDLPCESEKWNEKRVEALKIIGVEVLSNGKYRKY